MTELDSVFNSFKANLSEIAKEKKSDMTQHVKKQQGIQNLFKKFCQGINDQKKQKLGNHFLLIQIISILLVPLQLAQPSRS
jgi:hypothetical protein